MISEFSRQNLKAFANLFMQVVRIAREVGLVELGSLSRAKAIRKDPRAARIVQFERFSRA